VRHLLNAMRVEPSRFDGYADEVYWENLSEHECLQALADEFRQGICTPTPTRTSTCARCEFQNLCRIDQ
jgi:hypothetical protein